MEPKFSIVLNCYDPTQQQRHMTMACLAAIRKFTDQPYEIIVVDNEPKFPIRDEYNVLRLDKETVIVNEENQTAYHSYHQGAMAAKSDKIVFIQSDVYVHEKTINKLVKYLDTYDMAFPQQVPISREDVKSIYNVSDGQLADIGGRDAGMIAVRKDAYKKSGGWDGRFKNLLGEKAFFTRWDEAGLTWTDRTNCFITHIAAGNNLLKDQADYDKEMEYDSELIRKDYS